MKSYCGIERQTSSEQAYTRINQIIQSHHLKSDVLSVGSNIKTYQAFLTDKKNGKQFIGCGKGIGIQSEVSALFEAFEHYISYISFHNEDRATKLTVSENPHIASMIEQQLLPEHFTDSIGGMDTTLPWIKLRSLYDDQFIHYPLFLVEPNYVESNKFSYDNSSFLKLSYLSTGSGCASGSSFNEAIVHALNEAIERDATSLFLYNGFIRKNNIKIVDKTTIPAYLRDYIEFIEKENDDELFIINITSPIGVPCFCATFSKYNAPIIPKGFGASLSKNYALERAVLESLQPVHLRNDNLNRVENNSVQRLKDYPLLQKAAIADIKEIIQNKNFCVTDFSEIQDLYNEQDLTSQKDQILSLLQAKNLTAYYHTVYEGENYSLVKVIISDLSQLYILQLGKLILPNIKHLDKRLKIR